MQLFMPELISSSNHCPNLGTLHQKTHDTPPSPIHQRLILRLVVTTTAATPTPVTSPPSTAAAIIAAAVTAAATAPSSGVTWSRCTTGEACILQAKYVKGRQNSGTVWHNASQKPTGSKPFSSQFIVHGGP